MTAPNGEPAEVGGTRDEPLGSAEDVRAQLAEAWRELDRLRNENQQLRGRLGLLWPDAVAEPQSPETTPTLFPVSEPEALPEVDARSPLADKVALVRRLFRGQDEVYAVRWTNPRTGKAGYAPAVAGGWNGRPVAGRPKRHLPLTDEVVGEHLHGSKTIGVYPLCKDDTCWLLACDFDGGAWALDAAAFAEVCGRHGIPAALERSRSGEGGHVWIFFTAPVPASVARQMGFGLLRETMLLRAELDLASYDRFFPSQDVMPKGSFGNLIALPLHGVSLQSGNTLFCDQATLRPWPDQWLFLSHLRRMQPKEVEALAESLAPVRVGLGLTEPGTLAVAPPGERPAPGRISGVLGTGISVAKTGLPPWLLASIKHLASLHNPEFYQRQKLRLSTWQTPRFVKCYSEDLSHLHLPRGVLEPLRTLLANVGSRLDLTDQRPMPVALTARLQFKAGLTGLQREAVEAMLAHDHGVLVAPPGTGKTVMGCAILAARTLPTLVLVHRKPLLDQWRAQLVGTLDLDAKQLGQLGGGRNRPSGVVDLAMIQSLTRLAPADLVVLFGRYGQIVVDECHHIPAFSFESCLRHAPVRHVLGLTATPYRRDGLQDIITMQCGPIRHRIAPRDRDAELGARRLALELQVRPTTFQIADDPNEAEGPSIQAVFRALVDDEQRTALVCEDVLAALAQGRRCLVLSQWKEHVHRLAQQLQDAGTQPIVLEGGLAKKTRDRLLAAVQETPPDRDLVMVATGQYLGEGFDCPQLDTLFLTFPMAFKGKLVQYTGRLLRPHPGKRRVTVYDYADSAVPVLHSMHTRRLTTYRTLGFTELPTDPLT
jgi:superfamily II DNA or RNA helicase